MILFSALHLNYYPRNLTSNPSAARHISALSLGYVVLLGDVYPSELERLENLMPRRGLNSRPSDLQSKTLRAQPFCHHIYELYLNT